MISDVLFESVERINVYLNNPVFNNCYSEEMRKKIINLTEEMSSILKELDTPPLQRKPNGTK